MYEWRRHRLTGKENSNALCVKPITRFRSSSVFGRCRCRCRRGILDLNDASHLDFLRLLNGIQNDRAFMPYVPGPAPSAHKLSLNAALTQLLFRDASDSTHFIGFCGTRKMPQSATNANEWVRYVTVRLPLRQKCREVYRHAVQDVRPVRASRRGRGGSPQHHGGREHVNGWRVEADSGENWRLRSVVTWKNYTELLTSTNCEIAWSLGALKRNDQTNSVQKPACIQPLVSYMLSRGICKCKDYKT